MFKATYRCKRFLHGFRLTDGRMFGFDQPRTTYRPTELFVDGTHLEYKSVSVSRYSAMADNTPIGYWANPWLGVSPVRDNARIDMALPVGVGECVANDAHLCYDTGGTGWYVVRGHRYGLEFTRPHTALFRTSKGTHCFTNVPVTDRGTIARGRLAVAYSYDYSPATAYWVTGRPGGGVYILFTDRSTPGRYSLRTSTANDQLIEVGRVRTPDDRQRPGWVAVSPDGRRLVITWEHLHYSGRGAIASVVALYNLPTPTLQRILDVPMNDPVFSPDGQTLWGVEGGWNVSYAHRTLYGIDLD